MTNNPTLPRWYHEIFQRYASILQTKSALYVALSAGVDSNTLLHWLYSFKAELPPIYTIHVNHNWHDNYSHLWALFARRRSEQYGFTHIHYEAHFPDHDPRGLEAAGREMRYRKFGETMQENSLLCVGHHRSDQAETVMQRLLRSAGVRGLGAMRDFNTVQFGEYEIELFRPFLSISKMTLYRTAIDLQIPWMEDYSNHETEEMERNIIRNEIFPAIEGRFPQYESAFYQVSQFMQEADDLLVEVAEEDLKMVGDHQDLSQLSLPALLKLSPRRQKNLLQIWIRPWHISFSAKQLQEFFRTFIEQSPTHQSLFKLKEYGIYYYQGKLYLRPLKSPIIKDFTLIPAPNAPTAEFWQQNPCRLIPRAGGERFHPIGRHKSQTLKKLLQEAELPQWERTQCWLLQSIKTGDILWVNHLGFAQSLAPFMAQEGLIPKLITQ
ncbi:tRNA lysidine(34) synthetase TilS [Ignatzschineria ureiclastica]|uniref:tRNA(Ile)-lysidine synthase n=1 Tax=Ignatzschineria ureiclastica TaxID=472582 RepID=A0A2U2ACD7_9GAMM|nr:tRNA lysidine(34) synthetase TilS [Ignatzschineria ureiclastica]PWD80321.1 tRNA lysidine(34) synthetase TilS [Ignatzschineria ureiclastica]GHA02949.1 tRNA(Ile)-lysidine synthase [Ignatzschineria ureiclastica]